MLLVRLGVDDERDPSFDCGDRDLNEYFFIDSKQACSELIAVTYAYIDDDGKTTAFFSVSNDSIKREIISKPNIKKVAHGKRYSTLPSVKIGRFATHGAIHRNGLGSILMDFIKDWFTNKNKTGCRFIVVDAYNNDRAINFYKRNGFNFSLSNDENEKTRLMFFDLSLVKN
jgi:GNAT superfamily N-acetyltransferase